MKIMKLVLIGLIVLQIYESHTTNKKNNMRLWKSNKSQQRIKKLLEQNKNTKTSEKVQSQTKDKLDQKLKQEDEDIQESKVMIDQSGEQRQNELKDLIDKKIYNENQNNSIMNDEMRFKKVNRNEEANSISINEEQKVNKISSDINNQDRNQKEYNGNQKQYEEQKNRIKNKEMKQAVSNSVPDSQEYEQIPKEWQTANYTKEGLSAYSKRFLKQMNDPKYKDKGLLIGKPIYIENNITYDESPSVYVESQPRMTGVNVVQRQYDTQEKHDLWNKWLQEEFKQNFKDVTFNPDDPVEDNSSFSGIDNIMSNKKVKILLANKKKNKKWTGRPDHILENVSNPIKKQIYTKQTETNYQMNYINEANRETALQGIRRMQQQRNPMQSYMNHYGLTNQNIVNNNNVNIGFQQYMQQQQQQQQNGKMPRFSQMGSMSQFNLNQPRNIDLVTQLRNQQSIFNQNSPYGMNNYNYLNVPPSLSPTIQLNQLIMNPVQRNMMMNNLMQLNRFRR